jgi:uncharacterized protein with ParB-like and HNH nuclease domain
MTNKASATASSTYQPDKRTIGELLSMTTPAIVVPDWQRSYSWQMSQIETFWHDLMDFSERYPDKNINGKEYFFGSIVIVRTSEHQHLLLDGQQRVATSAILLSVIRDYLKRYKEDAAHRVQSRYLIDFDDATNEWRYKITLNAYDKDYYKQKILTYRDASYVEPKAEHASHRLIATARKFFEQKFEESYSKLNENDAYTWSLRIQNVLMNHMSVISVVSSNEDSAAEVFETLNDRGVGLSTPDLLRNLVIRRAPPASRDRIVSLWEDIIRFDSDTDIKGFLRHYWISNHGDVKTQRLYREIKNHLVDAEIPSLNFTENMREASEAYRRIVKCEDGDGEVELALAEVGEIGASVLMPIVLSIVQSPKNENRLPMLRAVISTFVRHSVIGQLENSKLENMIHPMAKSIRSGTNPETIIKDLHGFAPTDDVFKDSFARTIVVRSATQRYLLRKLENAKRRTGELVIGPSSKVHVEHIYPQTPEDSARFANHDAYINRIGNLTLLDSRFNASIKNGDFASKKPTYAKSEVRMTQELGRLRKWDQKSIEVRQADFADLALKIWSNTL